MTQSEVVYEGDLRTRCLHEESGDVIYTDAPKDNQGKGERFSPTDLVGVALASCIITIMGIYAKGMNKDITGTKARVTKEMSKEAPRRIGKIKVVIDSPHSFEPQIQQRLEKGGLTCPVHHSLHPDIELDITFNWGAK